MKDAPHDKHILVLALDPEGVLDPMLAETHWHPDAGFTVCELRVEYAWIDADELLSKVILK
jgi:hypothetical protein